MTDYTNLGQQIDYPPIQLKVAIENLMFLFKAHYVLINKSNKCDCHLLHLSEKSSLLYCMILVSMYIIT